MILDEAGDGHVAELVGEHRCARQLGPELGIGEAEREGKRRPADSEPERSDARIRLGLKREIGDDAAGEQHGDPKEPAVGLGLERAGG